MPILLFSTSVLLLISGALKLRASARTGIGHSPLALAELPVAVGLAIASLPGVGATPTAPWVVFGALTLMLASSLRHALRISAYREHRAASEASRLANYVKYMSDTDQES